MGKKITAILMMACLAAAVMVFGQSHDVAIAVGTPVVTQINCGEAAGGGEPYNATLTLLEFIRGPEALKQIKGASASNPDPKAGYEYILARIGFQMKPRGAPGDKTFDLGRPLQFTVFSTDLSTEYPAPSVALPKPELKRRVAANDPAEGWIAFEVKQNDGKPLMLFDPGSGTSWARGKSHFFKLYP